MGQRENVSQSKHLAPATAAPAKAADTGTSFRTLLGEVKMDRSTLPAQPRENIRGSVARVGSRARGGAVPGAARAGVWCLQQALGTPWAPPATASPQAMLSHKGLFPSSAALSAIPLEPNNIISFPFLPVPLISKEIIITIKK